MAATIPNGTKMLLDFPLFHSEVQKLTRDDYIGADETKLKALRAASQEADEKWVIAQKGNEPAAETLPFMCDTAIRKQIGNSVTPLLAQAVAANIRLAP